MNKSRTARPSDGATHTQIRPQSSIPKPTAGMATQATENTAHPTPPQSEHGSEPEYGNQKSDHENSQSNERQQPRPKTETEEKIAKETPPLSLDASAPGPDGAQRGPDKRVAPRSKRAAAAAAARAEDQNGSDGSHRPQDGRQVAPQDQLVQNKSKGGAPSVRLDMDLDVDIDLKAKIQGDLELSILGGKRGGG
ncbi:hypothetical protein LX36DRAFT_654132 [Colletotrichum falcatum]|nr:hypothetical protein LX36DRAFT_654132 [Colletotrichum falcatum]